MSHETNVLEHASIERRGGQTQKSGRHKPGQSSPNPRVINCFEPNSIAENRIARQEWFCPT
jgi:hypothetical protein